MKNQKVMKNQILMVVLVLVSIISKAQTNSISIICDSSNTNRAYCSSFTNTNNHVLQVFGPGVNSGGGYWADGSV